MSETPSGDGISRRSALKIGAAGCTSAAFATSIVAKPFSRQRLPCCQWQSAIDQDVRVLKKSFVDDASFRPTTLRLVEVVQQKIKPQPGQPLPNALPEHSISLLFEAGMRTQLENATYVVNHPGIGEGNLFINEVLSPTGADVRTFEAIIG